LKASHSNTMGPNIEARRVTPRGWTAKRNTTMAHVVLFANSTNVSHDYTIQLAHAVAPGMTNPTTVAVEMSGATIESPFLARRQGQSAPRLTQRLLDTP
jgi:hypothetical protein